MLTKRDVAEAKVLWARLQRGSSRAEDWSTLAAIFLIAQGPDLCAQIAADGFDTFVAITAPIYEGHLFSRDDYRRMYERVCQSTLEVDGPYH